MSEHRIDPNEIFNATKCFLEFGGTYIVGDDKKVYKSGENGEIADPVGILINKKPMQLMVFHDQMPVGTEHVILSIFTETLGNAPERIFFFKTISSSLGLVVRAMLARVIEYAINAEGLEIDYDKLHIITTFKDKIDATTATELAAIKTEDICKLYYDKKSKVAQLQSDIFDAETVEKYGKKIRKKTWGVLQGLIQEFFQVDRVETAYTHRATLIGSQEADATLHVFTKACEAIYQYAKVLLDMDVPVADMIRHVDLLPDYHKACSWFSSATSSNEKTSNLPEAPWNAAGTPLIYAAQQLPINLNSNVISANAPLSLASLNTGLGFITPDQHRMALNAQNGNMGMGMVRYADSPMQAPPSNLPFMMPGSRGIFG